MKPNWIWVLCFYSSYFRAQITTQEYFAIPVLFVVFLTKIKRFCVFFSTQMTQKIFLLFVQNGKRQTAAKLLHQNFAKKFGTKNWKRRIFANKFSIHASVCTRCDLRPRPGWWSVCIRSTWRRARTAGRRSSCCGSRAPGSPRRCWAAAAPPPAAAPRGTTAAPPAAPAQPTTGVEKTEANVKPEHTTRQSYPLQNVQLGKSCNWCVGGSKQKTQHFLLEVQLDVLRASGMKWPQVAKSTEAKDEILKLVGQWETKPLLVTYVLAFYLSSFIGGS